jgi:glycosyltransferase involved in cell wall biosynthesis
MSRPPPRKVVIVNTADLGGGAERFSWLLFKGLERRGVESWLVVGNKRTDDPRVLPLHASPYLDYRPYARWSARVQTGLARWIERRMGLEAFAYPFAARLLEVTGPPPDLIVGVALHGGYFDLRALPALCRSTPVVLCPPDGWLFTGHCACPHECRRWERGCGPCPDLARPPAITRDATRLNWWRKGRIYRRCSVYVAAPSRWQLDRAERSILGPAIRAGRVIPNGVDQTVFRPGSRLAARRTLGLSPDLPVALVVAHLGAANPYKDFAGLRAALQHLGAGGLAARVLVVGAARPPEHYDRIVVEHRPYTPSVAELARYYQAADLLVHLSKEETFSFVIVEAMSCALPVVASAVGAIPEVVADGLTGLLVPPGDPAATAGTLARVLTDPALRERLSRAAAARARETFDVERMIDTYASWFEEIGAAPTGRADRAPRLSGARARGPLTR